MTLIASAPGKLVLVGEYAVLRGAPALVAAVDARVVVRLERLAGPDCLVSAPLLGVHEHPFRLVEGRVRHRQVLSCSAQSALTLFCEVVEQAALHLQLPPFAVHIDSGALHRDKRKLGLGSSAAAACAIYAGLMTLVGQPTQPAAWIADAVAAHRRAQGGVGSGIDVAASMLGGLLRFELDVWGRPQAQPLSRPPGLLATAVLTDTATSTPAQLAALTTWSTGAPSAAAHVWPRLSQVAQEAVSAAVAAQTRQFLDGCRQFGELLFELGKASGVNIVSPAHRRLGELAARVGAVYKSSGAGGGDVGVLLTCDSSANQRFVELLDKEQGFHLLPLSLSANGVEVGTE